MKSYIRHSVVALTLASAALATPTESWLEDRMVDRHVEARQDQKCNPSGYTSQTGQKFTTYCSQNNPNNDAFKPPINTASMEDCMEHCSRYWGDREGCFGVVWVENSGNCWIRNSGTSTSGLKPSPTDHSALVDRDQMKGYDTKCPEADKSIHTLSGVDGLGYTVNCNKVINGNDACFSGVPQPCEQPFFGYHHTQTMEQCLRICVDSHPLCKAISWSPDLKIGWANCWLKTDFSDSSLQSSPNNAGVLHTATITRIDPVDVKCPDSKTYASGSKNFKLNCGQVNTGTNITSVHTQNVTACMDACATSDQNCQGVVFDSKLGSGFKNCYLKNTTSTTADLAGAMYAVLSDAPPSSASPSPSSSSGSSPNKPPSSSKSKSKSSKSSSSKAWIAGPVIGGIAALALIAFLAFWLRKRKARRAGIMPAEKDGVPSGQYGSVPAYSPGSTGYGSTGMYDGYAQGGVHAHHGEPVELQNSEPREMPVTTKYAHSKSGAQELP